MKRFASARDLTEALAWYTGDSLAIQACSHVTTAVGSFLGVSQGNLISRFYWVPWACYGAETLLYEELRLYQSLNRFYGLRAPGDENRPLVITSWSLGRAAPDDEISPRELAWRSCYLIEEFSQELEREIWAGSAVCRWLKQGVMELTVEMAKESVFPEPYRSHRLLQLIKRLQLTQGVLLRVSVTVNRLVTVHDRWYRLVQGCPYKRHDAWKDRCLTEWGLTRSQVDVLREAVATTVGEDLAVSRSRFRQLFFYLRANQRFASSTLPTDGPSLATDYHPDGRPVENSLRTYRDQWMCYNGPLEALGFWDTI